ncbi:tumor necrosis factor receptor superfamily member 18 isoform X1 [Xyrauchen texanus]|uniref:tumor necrosis factor receptor superfamily member 18 isoform X1 n=1 Tax=Xyrauchen texanus TaxID=154827 RepID=UPI002242BBCC|nr:tumor necrosis factor receptor superfamily member 18 isoform X1 [Xyrauchen texanus]
MKKRTQTIKGIWILSLAINCDWTTEYEFKGKCCKTCPSGEYPKGHCKENNSDSVCERCQKNDEYNCFCEGEILCKDNTCSECVPKEKCKPGYQLIREGNFVYTYQCVPCPNNTYNDAEDNKCKPFAKCDGLRVSFPGNSTHNARCDTYDHPEKGEKRSQSSHPIMTACLTITVFICLVLIMHTAFQTFKHRRHRKKSQPCTHRMVLPSDACNCQLSKEEIGDDRDSKTALEISLNCDVLSCP